MACIYPNRGHIAEELISLHEKLGVPLSLQYARNLRIRLLKVSRGKKFFSPLCACPEGLCGDAV
jgi:hypothetical protein